MVITNLEQLDTEFNRLLAQLDHILVQNFLLRTIDFTDVVGKADCRTM